MTLDQSVAEALDSVNWLSVQSPLKDVFLKFIESIEHQNTEIMRLDQEFKCFLLERDGNTRTLTSEVADCFSCLNTKADQRLLSAIESNYSKTDDQMEELKMVVLKQSEVIMNLNTALKAMEAKMEKSVDQKAQNLEAYLEQLFKSDLRNTDRNITAESSQAVMQEYQHKITAQLACQSNDAVSLAKEIRTEISALSVRCKDEVMFYHPQH